MLTKWTTSRVKPLSHVHLRSSRSHAPCRASTIDVFIDYCIRRFSSIRDSISRLLTALHRDRFKTVDTKNISCLAPQGSRSYRERVDWVVAVAPNPLHSRLQSASTNRCKPTSGARPKPYAALALSGLHFVSRLHGMTGLLIGNPAQTADGRLCRYCIEPQHATRPAAR
ncbi:hypothetical protein EJ05DRAFT_278145 [Pseudovirgaria hyperparasitica]|uniref:Uncharacterized protein n=1 Tax=Pseudovirgaria hyperparasitica TaxID=470096 RepID=A0A6A6WBR7_9PEZI|nr:uncharacterized protein EJ05DRAFT_278145 [Pseudovirgaria hyperparasitica]KAF2760272.1 hypothetical protein EJ05DRAFT_278145 [Pseudovirgaria hyperparasitica]